MAFFTLFLLVVLTGSTSRVESPDHGALVLRKRDQDRVSTHIINVGVLHTRLENVYYISVVAVCGPQEQGNWKFPGGGAPHTATARPGR
jgi:hypothetical protein